jgi:hypothetical protein
MPLKTSRLIEDGRSPEAIAEQAIRADKPPIALSFAASSFMPAT